MNDMYIIPANSKNGRLIFNMFRGIDLIVFLTGVGITIIFFLAMGDTGLWGTLLKIAPICIGSFLVVPLPYYHNIMEFIKEAWLFIANRRVYLWKGWCVRSEYEEE